MNELNESLKITDMYKVIRITVNGLNDDLSLNITDKGTMPAYFTTKKDAQKYLKSLWERCNPNRFQLKEVCKNEFKAYFKPMSGRYFKFYILKSNSLKTI